jgi:hypothetical protein
MPGDRPVKKGSFGSHLDELVKVFETEAPKAGEPEQQQPGVDGAKIHDRLFESTWRKAREAQHPNR